MRWVIVLIALTCLIGGAAAQTIFTGEGYSASQLAFYNGPNTVSFEPNVEKYWDSYITNAGNITPVTSNPANSMNIWFNSFPLTFDKQIQLKSSSFVANASATTGVSETEQESAVLKRNVNFNFNSDLSWMYTPKKDASFSYSAPTSVPSKDSQGQIVSQSIISLFG